MVEQDKWSKFVTGEQRERKFNQPIFSAKSVECMKGPLLLATSEKRRSRRYFSGVNLMKSS